MTSRLDDVRNRAALSEIAWLAPSMTLLFVMFALYDVPSHPASERGWRLATSLMPIGVLGTTTVLRRQRRIREAVAEFRLARAAAEALLPEDSTGRVANLFRRFHLLMFGEAEELKRKNVVAPAAAVRPGAAEGDPPPPGAS